MRRRRGVAGVAVAGLLIVGGVAAGIVVGALVLPQPVPPMVAEPPVDSAETITVSEQVFDGAREVSAVPGAGVAKVLRSRATGVVTVSECSPAGVIRAGSVPLFVDGQPVIALALTSPLWRDLAPRDKGADVTALQSELARLGHDLKITGSYDAQTRTVMRQLMTDAGGGLPLNAPLPHALFLWLPSSDVTVSSCAVAVGDTVSAGQEVATLAGGLTQLRVTKPPGGGWVARYGEREAGIDDDGLIDDPAFLAAVEAGPEYRLMTESGGATGLTVTVKLKQPRATVVVPPSAVVVKGAGRGCVAAQGRAVAVEIVSSTLGQTLVQPVEAGLSLTEVDVNPSPSITCQ